MIFVDVLGVATHLLIISKAQKTPMSESATRVAIVGSRVTYSNVIQLSAIAEHQSDSLLACISTAMFQLHQQTEQL